MFRGAGDVVAELRVAAPSRIRSFLNDHHRSVGDLINPSRTANHPGRQLANRR